MNFELIKKFANDLAREYVANKVPLADQVLSFCQENNLNPEQVRNVIQLVNTLIHLLLFENKTDDKIIEFDPLDPDVIITKLFKEPIVEDTAEDTSKTVSVDLYDDLSPLLRSIRNRLNGNVSEKTVDLTDVFGPGVAQLREETGPNSKRKQLLIMKIQKTAEELKLRYLEAGTKYCEFLDTLATKFASLYGPDIDDFAKEAFAYRGQKAVPVLADVYQCLKRRMPTLEKTAALVDATKEELQILDAMLHLQDEYTVNKLAYERLENALNDV